MRVICSTRGDTDGVQWFVLCDFIIFGISRSSLHSPGTEFDWQVGLVFLSCSAGNKASVSATKINDTSSGDISSYSKPTVRKNFPRPFSSFQGRPPVRMHAAFLVSSTSQLIAVKSLTAVIGLQPGN